jgi:hypothetical protein
MSVYIQWATRRYNLEDEILGNSNFFNLVKWHRGSQNLWTDSHPQFTGRETIWRLRKGYRKNLPVLISGSLSNQDVKVLLFSSSINCKVGPVPN